MSAIRSLRISMESSTLADRKHEPQCLPPTSAAVPGCSDYPSAASGTAEMAAARAPQNHVGECWNFNPHSEIFSQNMPNYAELFIIQTAKSRTSASAICYSLLQQSFHDIQYASLPLSPNKSALDHLGLQFTHL